MSSVVRHGLDDRTAGVSIADDVETAMVTVWPRGVKDACLRNSK